MITIEYNGNILTFTDYDIEGDNCIIHFGSYEVIIPASVVLEVL